MDVVCVGGCCKMSLVNRPRWCPGEGVESRQGSSSSCSTTDLCIQSRQLPHVEELLEQALQDSDSLRCGQMEV